jgi:hypothetical protein
MGPGALISCTILYTYTEGIYDWAQELSSATPVIWLTGTSESRLAGAAYTGDVPSWLNNTAKIGQNLILIEYLL